MLSEAVVRDDLEDLPPWQTYQPPRKLAPREVPLYARVAMLRLAGVVDIQVIAGALELAPALVTAAEACEEYKPTMGRLRAAAALDSWRAHVESVVASGKLPSGTDAKEATQAALLTQLFDREEPKAREGQVMQPVIVMSESLVERMAGALMESTRDIIDVTPRTTAPPTDPELERQVQSRVTALLEAEAQL